MARPELCKVKNISFPRTTPGETKIYNAYKGWVPTEAPSSGRMTTEAMDKDESGPRRSEAVHNQLQSAIHDVNRRVDRLIRQIPAKERRPAVRRIWLHCKEVRLRQGGRPVRDPLPNQAADKEGLEVS